MFDLAPHEAGISSETDQARAIAKIMAAIEASGLTGGKTRRMVHQELAVLGKAGTGKTHVLAAVTQRLTEMGFTDAVAASEDGRRPEGLTFSVGSPTNKAASVLRKRGVSATTIHRMLYEPEYAPDFIDLSDWLRNPDDETPSLNDYDDATVDQIIAVFQDTGSMPAALGAVGLRTSDFITGWRVRNEVIDVALIDEASMITEDMVRDLRQRARVLIFFGDPAQLAPVGCSTMPALHTTQTPKAFLTEIRRQGAGNPILDLAHLVHDPKTSFADMEAAIREIAARDERVVVSATACADTMRVSPMLVWRNDIRRRATQAWRAAHGLAPTALGIGEPVIITGVEPGRDPETGRMALEQAGLIKGATAIYAGAGRKPNHVRLTLPDNDGRIVHVGAVVEFEQDRGARRTIGMAARFGVIITPCPAMTIHSSQGSQYHRVQVFGPDIAAAAASGREESGVPLWKRLAYVAITRAQNELVWVTSSRMSRPTKRLGLTDENADLAMAA